MKMNYLSGDNKNILGKRLSNRYLSSDAFTSSRGKTSGRSISKLGSLFGGGSRAQNRKLYGTGQRYSISEFTHLFLTTLFCTTCLIVIVYTVPAFRYKAHGLFTRASGIKNISIDNISQIEHDQIYIQDENTYPVSPVFGNTDRFYIGKSIATDMTVSEDVQNTFAYVYNRQMDKKIPIGSIVFSSSTTAQLILFSELGQKNVLFAEDKTTTASTTIKDILFEGFGYGGLYGQVLSTDIYKESDVLYIRTAEGLIPVALIVRVEKDMGSTFTNIYAQLLTSPSSVYQVYIDSI